MKQNYNHFINTLIVSTILIGGCSDAEYAISAKTWLQQEPRINMVISTSLNFPTEIEWGGFPIVISEVDGNFQAVVAISPYSSCKLRFNKLKTELVSDCHQDRYSLSGQFLGIADLTAEKAAWKYGDLPQIRTQVCEEENKLVLGKNGECGS